MIYSFSNCVLHSVRLSHHHDVSWLDGWTEIAGTGQSKFTPLQIVHLLSALYVCVRVFLCTAVGVLTCAKRS